VPDQLSDQLIDPSEQQRLHAEVEADLAAAGIKPMTAERLAALARESPFESDEELEAFLAVIYEARRRD
jgi:hypothetical protein